MKNQTEKHVGTRIKAFREARSLSLRALAERCGLSVNAISLIERGENSPTVSSLHRLAAALGTSIVDFFRDEDDSGAVFISRDKRLSYEKNGVRMESLGIGLANQQLEPFLITLSPGSKNDRSVVHPGQEFVYCVAGEAEYLVGKHSYTLQTGDSLLFDATIPHLFRNNGTEEATLLIVFQTIESVNPARRRHLDA